MLDLSVRARAAISLSVILLVASLLVLTSLVGVFRGAFEGASESRFGFSVSQSRTAIENGISLGFLLDDLSRLRGTHGVLEQEKARDPAIESIFVIDTEGRIVFSTDALMVDRVVSPHLQLEAERATLEGNGALWAATDDLGSVVALPLVSSLDRPLGHVVLRYDRGLVEAAVLAGWFSGAQIALGILAPGLLILVAASWRVVAPIVRRLEATEAAFQKLSADGTGPDLPAGAVTGAATSYGTHYEALSKALDREEQELTRLDEAA